MNWSSWRVIPKRGSMRRSAVTFITTLALLMGAVGMPAQAAGTVSFARTDYPISGPESVAVANLDGKLGPDLVLALPSSNAIGVMLNKGNGTFGSVHTYKACSQAGIGPFAIKLGDVTTLTGGFSAGDGKVDAVVACPPDVAVLAGRGNGKFAPARWYNLGLTTQNGIYTQELIGLAHLRVKGPPVLVFQGGSGPSYPHHLCAGFNFALASVACDTNVPVQGPMAVGPLNPAFKTDFVITGTTNHGFAAFVYSHGWLDSVRQGGPTDVESAALGDLNGDGHPDVLVGHLLNPSGPPPNRVANALNWLFWNPKTGILPYSTPGHLSSINGLDAIGIADFNGDGHNDIVAANDYGRAVVHLGNGAGKFDNGHDIPLIGFGNPATATRVTLAIADFNCDHRPDVVITDQLDSAVMALRNTTPPNGKAGCK